MGEALGQRLATLAKPEFAPHSIAFRSLSGLHAGDGARGHRHGHAAHPSGRRRRAIGAATHRDFRLLCSLVRGLDRGGVYLNVGSAVVLPEVFLKAVSAVRNLGHPLAEFTTVNFDFLQHYRPKSERGGAAARALRRPRLRDHRPP